MKAIILAAGFSTRLYPLTRDLPKGLLPIQNKPIIEYMLDDLLEQDLDEIYLVTNDRCLESFKKYLDSQERFQHIKLLSDGSTNLDNRLGALGDLMYVIEQEGIDDDFLVCVSDTLSSLKLNDLISLFKEKQGFTTVVYDMESKNKIAGQLGCVTLGEGGEVTSFKEKPANPQSTLVSVPFYIYPKNLISKLPKYKQSGRSLNAPGSIIEWFLEQGIDVWAHRLESKENGGYYYDVGTVEVYQGLKDSFKF